MEDGTVTVVEGGAWAVVAPPRFAPQLVNVVTLYDTMFDVAVRELGMRQDIYADGTWNRDYRPSWQAEVLPILQRIDRYRWVAAIPRHAHALDLAKLGDPNPRFRALREFYFALVRPPDEPNLERSPPARAAADADAVRRQLLRARAPCVRVPDLHPGSVLHLVPVGARHDSLPSSPRSRPVARRSIAPHWRTAWVAPSLRGSR